MQFRSHLLASTNSEGRDISGLTLCQQIRQRDGQTPVVIFSGHGYEADHAAGMRVGANAYIVKPTIGEIVPIVKRLLAQAHVRK